MPTMIDAATQPFSACLCQIKTQQYYDTLIGLTEFVNPVFVNYEHKETNTLLPFTNTYIEQDMQKHPLHTPWISQKFASEKRFGP